MIDNRILSAVLAEPLIRTDSFKFSGGKVKTSKEKIDKSTKVKKKLFQNKFIKKKLGKKTVFILKKIPLREFPLRETGSIKTKFRGASYRLVEVSLKSVVKRLERINAKRKTCIAPDGFTIAKPMKLKANRPAKLQSKKFQASRSYPRVSQRSFRNFQRKRRVSQKYRPSGRQHKAGRYYSRLYRSRHFRRDSRARIRRSRVNIRWWLGLSSLSVYNEKKIKSKKPSLKFLKSKKRKNKKTKWVRTYFWPRSNARAVMRRYRKKRFKTLRKLILVNSVWVKVRSKKARAFFRRTRRRFARSSFRRNKAGLTWKRIIFKRKRRGFKWRKIVTRRKRWIPSKWLVINSPSMKSSSRWVKYVFKLQKIKPRIVVTMGQILRLIKSTFKLMIKQRLRNVKVRRLGNINFQLQNIQYSLLANQYVGDGLDTTLNKKVTNIINIKLLTNVSFGKKMKYFIIHSFDNSIFRIKKSSLSLHNLVIVCLKTGFRYYLDTRIYNRIIIYNIPTLLNSMDFRSFNCDFDIIRNQILTPFLSGWEKSTNLLYRNSLVRSYKVLCLLQLLCILSKFSRKIPNLIFTKIHGSRLQIIKRVYYCVNMVPRWVEIGEEKIAARLYRSRRKCSKFHILESQKRNYTKSLKVASNFLLFSKGWFNRRKLNRWKMHKRFFNLQMRRYRHITKHRLFITLFRGYFKFFSGFNEKELMYNWFQFRRKNTKFWAMSNLVQRFSQSLLLTPKYLILFFGFATTIHAAAAAAAASGSITINGCSAAHNYFLLPGDTMQVIPKLIIAAKKFYHYQEWNYLKLKISYIRFLLVDWSMLMFTSVEWPKKYELCAPSYLSERWVRFYIRHFPVRQRKYQKVKMEWRPYPRPYSVFKDMTGRPVFAGRRRW
jgi:hypothetical protein